MLEQHWREIRFFFICAGIAALFLTSCSSNKYLTDGQTFLEENKVRIKSEHHVKNKGTLKSDLEDQYRQRATRVIFGIPRHWFYYQTRDNPDSTWLKTWVNKRLADPPVIYDSLKAEATVEAMAHYLRQRGYWDAQVEYRASHDRMRTIVTYDADPGLIWTVSSLSFVSQDSTIQEILDHLYGSSYLSVGEPVDVELYELERSRITRAMQNRGYANFFKNYISAPIADSSDTRMSLVIEVQNPPEGGRHQVYKFGNVTVYPDYSNPDPIAIDTVIAGVRFLSPDSMFLVKPEVILRHIYIQTGETYSRDDYDKTLRQLSQLETYKFISVKPSAVQNDTTAINYTVYLTRNKKMSIGGDIELNYSTLAQRTLMGLGLNLNYRNRNIFHGAELFTTNIETGIEFNLQNTDSLINSLNINLQNELYIPRFIDPVLFYTGLNRIRLGKHGLLGDNLFRWLNEGSSRISLGYQFLSLFNLYSYQSFNASLGYDAQPDRKRRLQLNQVGLDFFSPQTRPAFDTILAQNQFLRESFSKQLFTGFLFRDYRFTYNSTPRRHGPSYTLIHSGELSGLEVYAVNTIYNRLSGRTGDFSIGTDNPLEFSHYARFEFDSRMYQPISNTQQLAFRFAVGVAFPYGPYSSQVPYVKQFYLGGPISIRAWQIRELGPGGYNDPNVSANSSLPFYQTGDVKLEFSGEYRFELGWIFEGAFFLDAGNVWTLKNDPDRPQANITANFLKQIAVGTGVGLRLDFTYFLIRLDLGYKLRNPYPDEEGRQWLFHNFSKFSFNQFTTNFAIGYPF